MKKYLGIIYGFIIAALTIIGGINPLLEFIQNISAYKMTAIDWAIGLCRIILPFALGWSVYQLFELKRRFKIYYEYKEAQTKYNSLSVNRLTNGYIREVDLLIKTIEEIAPSKGKIIEIRTDISEELVDLDNAAKEKFLEKEAIFLKEFKPDL